MSGRKEVLWAVVISAALVTAGFTLSCGDENGDNGGATAICQDACEKIHACDFDESIFFGETVADCVEACEEELAGGGGGLAEVFECIPDVACWDIIGICICQETCENFIDCDLFWYWENTAECGFMCFMTLFEEPEFFYMFTCPLRFSSCLFIEDLCYVDVF